MSLKDRQVARITQNGPISVADYMTECLLHPSMGYYATRDPFGASGDFITAPEISQMFGEVIGLSLAQAWMDQGCPSPFTLAELGPGRGTLMSDMLRATRKVPGFWDAAHIVLVEKSSVLRDIQRNTISPHRPQWVDAAGDLPDAPLFLVANEFFDALPIRQFVRDGRFWRERCVGLVEGQLAFGLSAPTEHPELKYRQDDTKDGDLVEICPTAPEIVAQIGHRIATHGGAALILDYGDWRSLGDTLQAVQNHKYVGVLDAPGLSDLTAHVDFEALCAAVPCAHTKITPQGQFLERLGITERARALTGSGRGVNRNDIQMAHHRLTHPTEMGTLFKTVGLYRIADELPPGLTS